jgi:hypothetical protein
MIDVQTISSFVGVVVLKEIGEYYIKQFMAKKHDAEITKLAGNGIGNGSGKALADAHQKLANFELIEELRSDMNIETERILTVVERQNVHLERQFDKMLEVLGEIRDNGVELKSSLRPLVRLERER